MQKAKATNRAAGNEKANPKRRLTRAEKKQIAEVIRQAKGDGKAHTAQQTIPYLTMYPDGICRVSEKKYSKSVAFEDKNYQLAQPYDKTAILENWSDFINYFDSFLLSIRGRRAAKRKKLSLSRHRTTLSTLSVPSTGKC